jgi:hypothetical protein
LKSELPLAAATGRTSDEEKDRYFAQDVSEGVGIGGGGLRRGGVRVGRFCKAGEMLNLGVIAAGGQGKTNWTAMLKHGKVRIAAMCDTDANMLTDAKVWCQENNFPTSFNTYADYRKMLESEKTAGRGGGVDARPHARAGGDSGHEAGLPRVCREAAGAHDLGGSLF